MGKRKRTGSGVKRVLVSLEPDLLKQVDERAESLGLSRSEYLYRLAEQDIRRGGAFELLPAPRPGNPGETYPPHQEQSSLVEEGEGPPTIQSIVKTKPGPGKSKSSKSASTSGETAHLSRREKN